LNNRRQSIGPKPDSRPRLEGARYKYLTSCSCLLPPPHPSVTHTRTHHQPDSSPPGLAQWACYKGLSVWVQSTLPKGYIHRFRDLRRFIRFDNKETRPQRVQTDKLAAISDLWSMFLHNALDAMIPGLVITVDERLAPYRGRCRFIQYMPTKPAKYGIKLWMCCDAETKYVYNASVYCGKENASEATCRDLGGKVVRQLLEPLHCEGRNITTDNYFTSLGLARDLLKAKKAT